MAPCFSEGKDEIRHKTAGALRVLASLPTHLTWGSPCFPSSHQPMCFLLLMGLLHRLLPPSKMFFPLPFTWLTPPCPAPGPSPRESSQVTLTCHWLTTSSQHFFMVLTIQFCVCDYVMRSVSQGINSMRSGKMLLCAPHCTPVPDTWNEYVSRNRWRAEHCRRVCQLRRSPGHAH